MMKRIVRGLGFVILMLLSGGLSSIAWAQMRPEADPSVSPGASISSPYQYRLGSGDKIQVTTFGEPTLSGPFEVNGAGMVDMPLIGEIKAKGLTADEFSKAVAAAFRNGFLRNPDVSVEVLSYRPFYILGEVNKPGEYPYTNGLTVLNAVATANGFTYRANTHHVFIKRANDTEEHDVVLNATTPVEPGDTIRIKERYF